MVEVIVIVRTLGTVQPDFSLNFELPGIPRIGDYISIRRLDQREPFGEDVIVRHVWWADVGTHSRPIETFGCEP
jgi:hypothetical protein